MTQTSYNGWPASPDLKSIGVRPFAVASVPFPGGVKVGDVADVLFHVVQQHHLRVERLMREPGCWGASFRPNKNNPKKLSCHASGTAVDVNAPKHPNGIEASKNFSPKQIAEVHQILNEIHELDEVVHWGGDWHRPNLTPDPMHYEIHDHDTAKLARVAERIRRSQEPTMNHVQQGHVDLHAMLRAGDKALAHFDAADPNREAVKSFATTLRETLRILRAAEKKLPEK